MIEWGILGYGREPTLGTSATHGYTVERQGDEKVRDRDEISDCWRPRDKRFYRGGGGVGGGRCQFYLGE